MRKPPQLELTKTLHWQIHKGKENKELGRFSVLEVHKPDDNLSPFSYSLSISFSVFLFFSHIKTQNLSPPFSLTPCDYIHMLSRDRWGQHPTYSRHSEALTLVRKPLHRLVHMHTPHGQSDCLHSAGCIASVLGIEDGLWNFHATA